MSDLMTEAYKAMGTRRKVWFKLHVASNDPRVLARLKIMEEAIRAECTTTCSLFGTFAWNGIVSAFDRAISSNNPDNLETLKAKRKEIWESIKAVEAKFPRIVSDDYQAGREAVGKLRIDANHDESAKIIYYLDQNGHDHNSVGAATRLRSDLGTPDTASDEDAAIHAICVGPILTDMIDKLDQFIESAYITRPLYVPDVRNTIKGIMDFTKAIALIVASIKLPERVIVDQVRNWNEDKDFESVDDLQNQLNQVREELSNDALKPLEKALNALDDKKQIPKSQWSKEVRRFNEARSKLSQMPESDAFQSLSMTLGACRKLVWYVGYIASTSQAYRDDMDVLDEIIKRSNAAMSS